MPPATQLGTQSLANAKPDACPIRPPHECHTSCSTPLPPSAHAMMNELGRSLECTQSLGRVIGGAGTVGGAAADVVCGGREDEPHPADTRAESARAPPASASG